MTNSRLVKMNGEYPGNIITIIVEKDGSWAGGVEWQEGFLDLEARFLQSHRPFFEK